MPVNTVHRLSNNGLADRLGKLRAEMKPFIDEYNAARDLLVKRLNDRSGAINGKDYRATVSWSTPILFDVEKASTFLTPRQLKACQKKGKRKATVNVKALTLT